MATRLTHEIRREVVIGGEAYTVIIAPNGLRLSRKRYRSGRRMSWEALWREGFREHDDRPPNLGAPVPGGSRGV